MNREKRMQTIKGIIRGNDPVQAENELVKEGLVLSRAEGRRIVRQINRIDEIAKEASDETTTN